MSRILSVQTLIVVPVSIWRMSCSEYLSEKKKKVKAAPQGASVRQMSP